MSTSVVTPDRGGLPRRPSPVRARLLALAALVSVVALIDAEIAAMIVPAIMAAVGLLDLSIGIAYAAIATLGLLLLWLTAALGRHVWRVECALNAPAEAPPAG